VDDAVPRHLDDRYVKLVEDLFKLGDAQPRAEAIANHYLTSVKENEAGEVDQDSHHTFLNSSPIKSASALVSAMLVTEFMLRLGGYERFVDLALSTMLCARLDPKVDAIRRQQSSDRR
jgi:hypothetical protein